MLMFVIRGFVKSSRVVFEGVDPQMAGTLMRCKWVGRQWDSRGKGVVTGGMGGMGGSL